MRKPIYFMAAAALALALPGSVPAMAEANAPFDVFTGNGFLENCSQKPSSTNGFILGVCAGYLSGLEDRDGLREKERFICRPGNSTNKQMMDVVLQYLRNHPEDRHGSIKYLAHNALLAAFPCPLGQRR